MPNNPTTKAKANLFETTRPMLSAMRAELKELSRKKPDATLNKSKVKMINRLLSDLTVLLEDEPDRKYLDLLDDEDLPQYSDVVLLLSQFDAAMTAFRNAHTERYAGESHWDLSDGDEDFEEEEEEEENDDDEDDPDDDSDQTEKEDDIR